MLLEKNVHMQLGNCMVLLILVKDQRWKNGSIYLYYIVYNCHRYKWRYCKSLNVTITPLRRIFLIYSRAPVEDIILVTNACHRRVMDFLGQIMVTCLPIQKDALGVIPVRDLPGEILCQKSWGG